MPLGDFTIGRSSDCNLALGDGLVSRRHAVLHVTEAGVILEDLGSRNGVSVNGTKVEGSNKLEHMDRLYIGSQELVLIDSDRLREGTIGDTSGYVVCSGCGAINGAAKRRCGECDKVLSSQTAKSILTHESQESSSAPGTEETRTARALDVIGGIASKAIAMGRFEDAERLLAGHLDQLLDRARQRGGPSRSSDDDGGDSLATMATQYALQLGAGLESNRWVDWVFQFHTATGQLMKAETIDTLHEVVRRFRYANPNALRDYLGALNKSGKDFTAGQRFLLRRLEGLEQVIASN